MRKKTEDHQMFVKDILLKHLKESELDGFVFDGSMAICACFKDDVCWNPHLYCKPATTEEIKRIKAEISKVIGRECNEMDNLKRLNVEIDTAHAECKEHYDSCEQCSKSYTYGLAWKDHLCEIGHAKLLKMERAIEEWKKAHDRIYG